MSNTVIDYLYLIAPETKDIDDETLDAYIDIARLQTKLGCGNKRSLAIAYLTAHTIALSTRNGSGSGSVSSLKEGQLSINFAALANNRSLYGQTPYGIEYARLIKSNVMAVRNRFVREPQCAE